MLPPFIIEQIRKREEQKREDHRPVLELPIEEGRPEPIDGPSVSPHESDHKPRRGIIVVDL